MFEKKKVKEFLKEVRICAEKYKVNFFCVSDGASETSNDGTNKCVEFHFQKQKEWEVDNV